MGEALTSTGLPAVFPQLAFHSGKVETLSICFIEIDF